MRYFHGIAVIGHSFIIDKPYMSFISRRAGTPVHVPPYFQNILKDISERLRVDELEFTLSEKDEPWGETWGLAITSPKEVFGKEEGRCWADYFRQNPNNDHYWDKYRLS